MGNRLVLAVSGIEHSVGVRWFEELRRTGCDFLTDFEVVFGKSRIFDCLDSRDDVSVIILSEYQGRERLSPEDIEQIESGQQSGNIVVIPIISDMERGNSYLAQLFSLGIYTAVFENDSAPANLSHIILHGRSRSETKDYYGISAQQIIDEGASVPPRNQADETHEVHTHRRSKKSARKSKKKQMPAEEVLELREYAVISTSVGVGSTFQTILMASASADSAQNARVAIVELDNEENNMQALCRQLNDYSTRMQTSFSLGQVDYYFAIPFEEFHQREAARYTTVIYDLGCCDDDTIRYIRDKVNQVFVVADGNEWHRGELAEFVQAVGPIDLDNRFIYLFPAVSRTIMENIRPYLKNARGYAVPSEENPFCPSNAVKDLFSYLLDFKGKEPEYPKPISLEKRCETQAKTKERIGKLGILLPALLGAALIASIFTGIIRYNKLYDEASALILQANDNIHQLKESIASYEETLASAEKTVLRLKVDVHPGDILTMDMVEEVTIRTTESSTSYVLLGEMTDKVFCLYLPAGTTIHDYMLCSSIEEEPPIITIGGAKEE